MRRDSAVQADLVVVILFTESFSLSAVKVLYGLACLRAV